jgi:hypothetical protein
MTRAGAQRRAIVAQLAGALAVVQLGACGRDAAKPNGAVAQHDELAVQLDAEQQRKLGIATAALETLAYRHSLEGPARVIDAQLVVASLADLGKAETDARTSAAAIKRARDLFAADAAVSAETLEAAQRQVAADDAQLRVARAHATLEFGAGAPWLDAARRESLLAALTDGTLAVVSATFPSGFAGEPPQRLVLRRIGASGDTWTATELWTGPADAAVPGPTLLALLPASPGLSPGERLTAAAGSGPALAGVVVPAAALVLAGGAAWCYVQTAAETFERRELRLDRPVANGYFQATGEAAGFVAGERVVVTGAGLLLAREIGGGTEPE